MEKHYEINFEEDFDNIPEETKILTIKTKQMSSKEIMLLNNLPIFLEEIHFDCQKYSFEENTIKYNHQENIFTVVKKFKIKIPFGCKIYNYKKQIENIDSIIKTVTYYNPQDEIVYG
jgi:hypothetical protein